VLSALYVAVGALLLMQRYDRVKLPGFTPPPTIEEREEAYQDILVRREEIAREQQTSKERKSEARGPS
jgi:hypothetical protein